MFVSSFLIVFVVLFVAWVVGFAFRLLRGLIHLLLVVALILWPSTSRGGAHRPHSPCGLLGAKTGSIRRLFMVAKVRG
jgi:hypothetical protein